MERVLPRRIYLDHAATTPMRPEAIAAVEEGMRRWANPSSPHAEGRAARAALEDARARIKRELGWDGELIFTSGASEALAIGLGRAKGGRRLVSAVEHDSVFRAAPGAAVIPMRDAEIDTDALADMLAREDRPVVAIQRLNSETGIRPLETEHVALVHAAGGVLLSDCAQMSGAVPRDVDMAVISAHKRGGPPGIGALLVRDFGLIEPSGGQEFGYRGGTENLPGALGFAAALEAVPDVDAWDNGVDDWESAALLHAMQDFASQMTNIGAVPFQRSGWMSLITPVAMPGLSAAAQLIQFDRMGFAVSAGSACSSGTLKPSRTLKALGVPDDVAARTIRVSFGWSTTVAEIAAFTAAWHEVAEQARSRAA